MLLSVANPRFIFQGYIDILYIPVHFFMLVQELYVFFSALTHRWSLLTDVLKPFQCPTTKPLPDTRWEVRYDALHALKKGCQAVL